MKYNLTSMELGKTLGLSMKQSSSYKEDFIESEELASISLVSINAINISGSYYVKKWNLASDSFVIDHPVYGYIDSPILKLDGGYATTGGDTFPLSFPISFEGISTYELISSGDL